MKESIKLAIAGACAGLVAGLLGAGGGMVLVPLLAWTGGCSREEVFPASLAVMLPVCLTCLCSLYLQGGLAWRESLVFLPGSALGGVAAGLLGKKIPVKWLHRGLGLLILWGGWRFLWQ